ncbi:cupin domain-containing protein [Croceicoccus gelatinilyticus]|uniref:cupin domain-containing protein n=1 Tax=Croceicoccus gelatinilyticus TaxID=2835536 RepID=UPI001BCF412F|nr:cupin domain-containing protein [Croceicoccus gelatinilyticus]MBS7670048.1 cupin domain-containing protein [Croceicoccus gelatinilyticus]
MTEHNPGKLGDLIVNINDCNEVELGTGTTIRLLRYSEETGDWVLWVKMEPGATFAPHWHLGHGQYFVTKGELIYDVGSAPEGTYGYEPIGSRHNEARCEQVTEYLFMGHGAVAFLDDDGEIRFILNHEFLRDVAKGDVVSNVANEGLEEAAE